MIGYHYTSRENWERIQREGLLPYRMDKPEMRMYFPQGFVGIWLWRFNPVGKSHAGNILYQVSRRASESIVKLAVQYDPKDILRWKGREVDIAHEGHVVAWKYHEGERSVVVTVPIPPQNIKLIKEYNVVDCLV